MSYYNIAICCPEDHPKYQESVQIANDIKCNLLTTILNSESEYILSWLLLNNTYYLSISKSKSLDLNIDYVNNQIAGKSCYKFTYNDALPKAIGLSNLKKDKISILDGTAGFTLDAYALMLLKNNIKLTLLENSKILYYLIKDGLDRLSQSSQINHQEISNNIKLYNTNFIDYLKNLSGSEQFDIIYLDPMFEVSKQKSKPKQNMQVLQDLCDNPNDALDLLQTAFEYQKNSKIILKRDNNQPKLLGKRINYSVKSKQIRYDVYLS
ncbi:MAG: class I SAM-dependent methyltransferase [Gammaproteobacteria bacterium]|nr:class I SAM-dependent methyltransferase [Gammaproteobacteria bacterium]